MRVAVAGAGGFIGRHVLAALRGRGWSATALVRAGQRAPQRDADVQLELDLGGRDVLDLGRRHDAAIFLAQSKAYREGSEGWADLFDLGVSGLVRFAEAARRAGVRRFVFASTGTVYRPSFQPLREDAPLRVGDPYATSKQLGEQLLALYDTSFQTTLARLFTVYGPGQQARLFPDVIDRVVAGRPVTLQPARAGEPRPAGLTVSTLHVTDAAEILCALLDVEAPGALNVASPDAISVRELAERVGRRVGRDPIFEELGGTRPGDLVADTRRLADLLAPRFCALDDGLRELVAARSDSAA